MKKFVSLVLISLVLIINMAACVPVESDANHRGNTNNSYDNQRNETEKSVKKSFSIMTWGDDSDIKSIINSLFIAYPDLKDQYNIQIMVGGKQDGEVADKFRLSISSNNDVPDLIQFNRSNVIEFAEADVIMDLTKVFKEYKGNVLPSALDVITYKNEIIGFPYEMKSKLWFYRKDLFDGAGINPNEVKNLNDFIKAGKALHSKYPKSYICNLGNPIADYNLGMVLSGNGARLVDSQGDYIVSDDKGIRKAFEAFKILKDSKVTTQINDWTPEWEKAYSDGVIASTLTGNWMKFFIPKYAKDQKGKWAVAQFPEIGDAVGGSEAGGSMFIVPSNAKNKEAAIEAFSKIFLTKAGNLSMRTVPGHETWTPVLKDTIIDPTVAIPDFYFGKSLHDEELKSLKQLKVFDFTPAARTEFKVLNKYLDKYLEGKISLDDALKSAENDLKVQVGNPFIKY